MAMNLLRSLAVGGQVPVFAIVGAGRADAVDDLCLSQGLQRVLSPRHASILLVTGEFRKSDRTAIERVHDQLPHPRATVTWEADDVGRLEHATALDDSPDTAAAIRDVYGRLMARSLPSEAALLPDEPAVPWRGVGEHGQGGKGMMGGTPYGRPIAMTGDDLRDGLSLDLDCVRLGPFFAALPPGLELECVLQGDVVQKASVIHPPYAQRSGPMLSELEHASQRARAASCLRSIARLLALLEMPAQAERCLRVAMLARRGDADVARKPIRAPGRSQALRAIPRDLGRIDPSQSASLGGVAPTARERLRDWFDDADAALRSVAKGEATRNDERSTPADVADPLPSAFVDLLVGLEWSEALIVIASFDVTALRRMSPSNDSSADSPGSAPVDQHTKHGGAHPR